MKPLFRKNVINGQNVSPAKCTELALRAVDSIMMTGFSSTEELYSLLKVNCMGSDLIIDEALRELANTYNNRAAKDAELLHKQDSFQGLKESYITNIVLMDDKLKMIADIRSYIAMQKISEKELQELPINTEPEELIEDASSIISSIAAAVPEVKRSIPMLKEKKS
jgi:hypothetical protein